VASVAPDGLVEAVEVPGRRFALGVQWHPERCENGPGVQLAEALVQTATAA
jgi:putative glutamine amidotransferase